MPCCARRVNQTNKQTDYDKRFITHNNRQHSTDPGLLNEHAHGIHTNLLLDPQSPSRLSMGFASVPTGKQLAKKSAMG